MKNSKRLHSVALASTFLILLLALVSSAAAAATEQNISPTFTETRITTSGSVQSPAIYGDTIVWQDYRNDDNSGFRNWDIYMYDLSTQKETQITTNKTAQCYASIYGNKIVWEDQQGVYGDWNIYMYDLSTKKETQITTDRQAQSPDIYGDRVVWDENSKEGWEQIHMYNLSTHQETSITNDGNNCYYPTIYGDRIVWEDWRNYGGADIYMYDLSTSKETQITTNESDQWKPDIYGNWIVWQDYRNSIGYGSNPNIYMYDLSTKKETQITTSGSANPPAIYEDRIVYSDSRNGNSDIYMYNVSTHKEIQITTSAGSPAIYGDRIVYSANRNGKTDIYMCTLGSSIPVASFTSNVTSGNAPLNVAFTDTSTGTPTKWKWSLGDGATSTKQNPVHKYSKAGKYTVSLTVNNAAGSNTTTKTNYITVVEKPVAAFSAKPTSGKALLTVAFTDKSTGSPTKWKWTFGDGTSSTVKNPTHKYLQEGNYTVKLTATNAAGSNTTTKTNYIKVTTNTRPGIYSSK